MMESASILVIGANSSLCIPVVEQLLSHYPQHTLILTVRDPSNAHAQTLKAIVSKHSNATAVVRLDLSDLSAVSAFTSKLAEDIASKTQPPLCAIIAAAYHWNLVRDPELTVDGYDQTIQVGFIAHVSLILRLLGSFGPGGGRILLFSSDAHWPGKNGFEKYPPEIPTDLSKLVRPRVGDDKFGLGFQQYACTKLAGVAWLHALNKHLEKDPKLNTITAIAMNPGNLLDSRALSVNAPRYVRLIQLLVLRPFAPLIRLLDPTARSVRDASADVAKLAVDHQYAGASGHYTLLAKDESSPESRDEGKQKALWTQSAKWALVGTNDTVISLSE